MSIQWHPTKDVIFEYLCEHIHNLKKHQIIKKMIKEKSKMSRKTTEQQQNGKSRYIFFVLKQQQNIKFIKTTQGQTTNI